MFWTVAYFLTHQDIKDLSCSFSVSILKLAISSRSSGSFGYLETNIWALSVLITSWMLLLLGVVPLLTNFKNRHVFTHIHLYLFAYLYLYLNPLYQNDTSESNSTNTTGFILFPPSSMFVTLFSNSEKCGWLYPQYIYILVNPRIHRNKFCMTNPCLWWKEACKLEFNIFRGFFFIFSPRSYCPIIVFKSYWRAGGGQRPSIFASLRLSFQSGL